LFRTFFCPQSIKVSTEKGELQGQLCRPKSAWPLNLLQKFDVTLGMQSQFINVIENPGGSFQNYKL